MAASVIDLTIPDTQTSATSKPYTIYNIHCRLPLRSFTLQKRYSDFTKLHDALISQAGSAPPTALPGKSWFSSTTNNPALTEERRRGLENYLQSINSPDSDSRWRNTSAWRSFLNLPGSNSGSNSRNGSIGNVAHSNVAGVGDAPPITDPALWLDAHRELKTCLHDARFHLSRRDAATTAQGQHEASAQAKRCLVLAGATIGALDRALRTIAEATNTLNSGGSSNSGNWARDNATLGEGELRRRRDLIASARKEKEGLEKLLNALATSSSKTSVVGGTQAGAAAATAQDKAGLFADAPSVASTNGNGGGGGVSGVSRRVLGGPRETERTRELDNVGVLQLQQQMMREQDEDVEQLGSVVRRLREMGGAINEELVLQNELLQQTDEDVTRLQGKIDIAKKRVNKIR
ncbi:putative SNARE complex subunit [Xylona heveae TC161]|uniref:Putative SNARE complex subunit n=1 Tax=Xylona heveae (strain CBS 132557 / TC161) TaxID=1328760 RepID=A0A161TCJ5_XYLHT|nr:putative SNARE complex subunit [Xylona heveae TC161]KZF23507.1 putative SNARE complex subunit [Xylona heveae TC161]